MLPTTASALRQDLNFSELPTNTYKLNIDAGIISGFADQIAAMRQAIYLILNIERYQFLIYSWNYGVELNDLYGKPKSFVLPECKRRISEALLQDTRILSVDDFEFSQNKEKLIATFTVHTIFGDIESETAVNV